MNTRHICIVILSALYALTACNQTEKVRTRIACIGDSITEGYGIEWQSDNAYPAQLQQLMGEDYEVMNFGRSSTTMMLRGDFPYWSAKEFTNALNFRPDIVVLKLGTNDCKAYQWNADAYRQSYLTMIDTLQSLPSAPRIILCLPVPVVEEKWTMTDSVITSGVIPVIQQVAELRSLEIVDMYSLFSNRPELFSDGIHPTKQGAELMASTIAETIRKH